MFTEGLGRLLEPSVEVVGVVSDGDELLSAVESLSPDVVVCDLSMPFVDGFEATRRLTAGGSAVRVVILSAHDDAAHVRGAFQVGARGYVVKSSAVLELLTAIDEVLAGRFFASPAVTGHLVGIPDVDPVGDEADRVRVLIVDDEPSIRLIARAQLELSDGLQVVGEAENGSRGVELALNLDPDIVLMDLKMPGMDGVEAIRQIRRRHPGVRILAVTSVDVDGVILEAIRAGAVGYVAKPAIGDLVAAVKRVLAGDVWLPASITRKLLELTPEPTEPPPLTEREAQISRLVARGWSNQRIADSVHLSEATVRTHLKKAFEKLELNNRVELALYAVRTGLAPLVGSDGAFA